MNRPNKPEIEKFYKLSEAFNTRKPLTILNTYNQKRNFTLAAFLFQTSMGTRIVFIGKREKSFERGINGTAYKNSIVSKERILSEPLSFYN